MDLKRIGVFTSGGDSPGMNACIRASVRCALAEGLEVYGIKRGYAGMIDGDFVEMDKQSVSNILQMGGTILKSARSDRFRTPEGRAEAAAKLREVGIDALIAIGGDGTLSSNGRPLAQLGVVRPVEGQDLIREDGVMFRAEAGFAPVENPRLLQGFLENSNVDPIRQIARMIAVQRAYEMGQSFLDAENERIRTAIQTFLK